MLITKILLAFTTLEIKSKALQVTGKHSATNLHPKTCTNNFRCFIAMYFYKREVLLLTKSWIMWWTALLVGHVGAGISDCEPRTEQGQLTVDTSPRLFQHLAWTTELRPGHELQHLWSNRGSAFKPSFLLSSCLLCVSGSLENRPSSWDVLTSRLLVL